MYTLLKINKDDNFHKNPSLKTEHNSIICLKRKISIIAKPIELSLLENLTYIPGWF